MLPAKFGSPPYAAIKEWDPGAKSEIVSVAWPLLFSAAEPIGPPKDAPKKMPAGGAPAKTELDVNPSGTPVITPTEPE